MNVEAMQAATLALLAVIAVVAVLTLVSLLRAVAFIREGRDAAQKMIAERDSGPALHGLVQQTREVNRQLANIDKRLEKLEALEKVQIAHFNYRDDTVRPVR
jgi:hypothetical protein